LYLKDINERKENIIKNRSLALNGLQTQASVMLRSSNQKIPSAQVGDTVRVRVPNIDRGRMDYQNILAVVMDVDNDFYKLGTKYGIISQLYTRNQFAVCKEKLISLNDVLSDKTKVMYDAIVKKNVIQKNVIVRMGEYFATVNATIAYHVVINKT
jgi:hypothetical protein